MIECNDYWCEYYGKDSEKCDLCEKKSNIKDKSDLQVILQRRADKQIKFKKNTEKNKGSRR